MWPGHPGPDTTESTGRHSAEDTGAGPTTPADPGTQSGADLACLATSSTGEGETKTTTSEPPTEVPALCATLRTETECRRFDLSTGPAYCRWSAVSVYGGDACEVDAVYSACVGFIRADSCVGSCGLELGQGFGRERPGRSELVEGPGCDKAFGWDKCFDSESRACCTCSVF